MFPFPISMPAFDTNTKKVHLNRKSNKKTTQTCTALSGCLNDLFLVSEPPSHALSNTLSTIAPNGFDFPTCLSACECKHMHTHTHTPWAPTPTEKLLTLQRNMCPLP